MSIPMLLTASTDRSRTSFQVLGLSVLPIRRLGSRRDPLEVSSGGSPSSTSLEDVLGSYHLMEDLSSREAVTLVTASSKEDRSFCLLMEDPSEPTTLVVGSRSFDPWHYKATTKPWKKHKKINNITAAKLRTPVNCTISVISSNSILSNRSINGNSRNSSSNINRKRNTVVSVNASDSLSGTLSSSSSSNRRVIGRGVVSSSRYQRSRCCVCDYVDGRISQRGLSLSRPANITAAIDTLEDRVPQRLLRIAPSLSEISISSGRAGSPQ